LEAINAVFNKILLITRWFSGSVSFLSVSYFAMLFKVIWRTFGALFK